MTWGSTSQSGAKANTAIAVSYRWLRATFRRSIDWRKQSSAVIPQPEKHVSLSICTVSANIAWAWSCWVWDGALSLRSDLPTRPCNEPHPHRRLDTPACERAPTVAPSPWPPTSPCSPTPATPVTASRSAMGSGSGNRVFMQGPGRHRDRPRGQDVPHGATARRPPAANKNNRLRNGRAAPESDAGGRAGLPDLLKARREAMEARWRGEVAARSGR